MGNMQGWQLRPASRSSYFRIFSRSFSHRDSLWSLVEIVWVSCSLGARPVVHRGIAKQPAIVSTSPVASPSSCVSLALLGVHSATL